MTHLGISVVSHALELRGAQSSCLAMGSAGFAVAFFGMGPAALGVTSSGVAAAVRSDFGPRAIGLGAKGH